MSTVETIPARRLQIEYDWVADVVTIAGVKYAGSVFREFGGLMALGSKFRLIQRDADGAIWIEKLADL
jgi:hypothetical protein